MGLSGRADFRMLYAAGYMVRTHHGAAIYRYDDQLRYQNALISSEDVALPFDHPAYEALAFAPLSCLSYRGAYCAVLALNLGLLALCIKLLRPWTRTLGDVLHWLPVAVVVGFLPVAITLIQGQDSILLLALFASAALFLERANGGMSGRSGKKSLDDKDLATPKRNEIAAGVCVGLALFKLQFALPVAVLFLAWRRWRFFAGFGITAILLAILSVLVSGPTASGEYVRLLLSVGPAFSTANQLRLGVYPLAMANLRGLFSAAFSSGPGAARAMTIAGSLLVLLFSSRRQPSFALALVAAALVSYHGLIHDMSFLLIPAGAMLENGLRMRSRCAVTIAIALLALPTTLFLTDAPYFLIAIPLILALGWAAEALQKLVTDFEPVVDAQPIARQLSG